MAWAVKNVENLCFAAPLLTPEASTTVELSDNVFSGVHSLESHISSLSLSHLFTHPSHEFSSCLVTRKSFTVSYTARIYRSSLFSLFILSDVRLLFRSNSDVKGNKIVLLGQPTNKVVNTSLFCLHNASIEYVNMRKCLFMNLTLSSHLCFQDHQALKHHRFFSKENKNSIPS